MRKLLTCMLSAATLLISLPSWAKEYPEGTERNLGYYKLPEIGAYSETVNSFGTICVPERIVATQGIVIYDVLCVDKFYYGGKADGNLDTAKVARLVVEPHMICVGDQQAYYDLEEQKYYDKPYCPEGQGTSDNPCNKKVWVDWERRSGEPGDPWYVYYDYRMKAGAAYFYTACGSTTLDTRFIYVDTEDVVSAPVGVNGFYGTFEETQINEPITVLTQDKAGAQFLEQVTKVTMPAHRGYFKGNFECVPWRWNTFGSAESHPFIEVDGNNIIHYPCSNPPKVPRTVSPNAIAFNVGPRNAATGLYPIDLEHPIYLNKESNKSIVNGQLIIEVAGKKYNALGQPLQ